MYAIQVDNLCKTYNSDFKALKDLSLTVNKGEFLCLLGRNGAGKTTFVQMLCSLVRITSGKVKVYGKDLIKDSNFVKSKIGLVPQEFNLAMFECCLQILITQAGYYGIPYKQSYHRAKELLQELDLWHKRKHNSMSLSGGMKRRLMIARALMHDPDVIFFDEPTAGVDIEMRQVVWEIMKKLNKRGKTIILTTHYFEEAEKLCDTLAILDQGKIRIHGNLNEILNKCSKQVYQFKLNGNLQNFVENNRELNIKILDINNIEVAIDGNLDFFLKKIINTKIEVLSVKPLNSRLEDYFLNIIK